MYLRKSINYIYSYFDEFVESVYWRRLYVCVHVCFFRPKLYTFFWDREKVDVESSSLRSPLAASFVTMYVHYVDYW